MFTNSGNQNWRSSLVGLRLSYCGWRIYLIASDCASPPAELRGQPGAKLQLNVAWHKGQKHLPIVTLKGVA